MTNEQMSAEDKQLLADANKSASSSKSEIMQGAATGATIGAAAGPWGAAIGGVAGGVLGWISEKEDEKRQDRLNAIKLAIDKRNAQMQAIQNTQNAYDNAYASLRNTAAQSLVYS